MNEWERLIREIKDCLAVYAVRVDMDKGEASRAAENFYCDLLNLVLGCHLENMNLVWASYPAIDLGDKKEGLGVQVTSTATRKKVQDTLDAMFRNGVEQEYPHLVMLITKEWRESRKAFRMDGVCQFDPEQDIWDTDWLLNRIGCITDLEHLRRILKHLKENLHIAERKALLQSLKPRSSLDKHTFVGREKECREIAAAFESGKRVVFLSGLGGIGKTELAVHYAARSGIRTYQATFSGSFAQTLRDSVAPKLPDFRPDGKNEAQIEREAMDALGQCDLLILDNADQANLTELTKELNGLPMRVLVTTRISEKTAIRVRRMENDVLYQIFVRHGVDISAEQMDDLIAAVDGHTMTVDMIARTLADDCCVVSPEDVRAAMSGGGMDEEDYPEIENDHDPEQRKIYGHLRALFRMQEMEDAGKQCLCCAALLPGDGMSLELFRKGLTGTGKQALPGLVRRGWLQCENKLLTIHPVVRLVCRTELEPTEEKCGDFLIGIHNQYDSKQYSAAKFRQMAELFETAANTLEDKNGVCAIWAGYFWKQVGNPGQALELDRWAVEQRERHQPDSQALAIAYNNLGKTYDDLGDHKQALEYKLKALAIFERVLGSNHPDIAAIYNNVGYTYDELGDHKQALVYTLKSLVICERVLGMNHPGLAIGYNNVSFTYYAQGNYEQALEYQMKALAILERVLEADHPDLATSYDNVGSTYDELGDHKQALEYKLKALTIRERVLGADHPDLATSYNNVGSTFNALGDHKQALEYQLKALSIWERVLPRNHPNLALSCNNIAWIYRSLGKSEEAASYMRRAAEIINRSSLPEGHEDRVDYDKWADRFEREARQGRGETD